MSSHFQDPVYPVIPDDDPGSSPSSSYSPPITDPYRDMNKVVNNGLEDYFSAPHTRRKGLTSRRSKSLLTSKSDRGRDSAARSAPSKGTKHDSSASRSRQHSSASTQALLIVTNDQLKRRIAVLENEQTQAVTMFADLVNERNALQAELNAAHTKTRMYEVQYEAAVRELRNAKQIIKRLEEQRTDAESSAARQRKRVRTLLTEKVVKAGWDQGYREGIEEGYDLVQRRYMMMRSEDEEPQDSRRNSNFFDRMTRMRGASSERPTRRSGTSRRSGSSSDGNHQPGRGESSSRASTPVPVSMHVSNTQPEQSSRPPSVPPYTQRPSSRSRSRTPGQREPRNSQPFPTTHSSPESIHPIIPSQNRKSSVPNSSIHRIPIHNSSPPSPALTHRTILPDGYIPSAGPHGIELPPPHELGVPTPPTVDGPRSEQVKHESRGRQMDTDRERKSTRSRMTSRASTRISDYDLVSPPRQASRRNDERKEGVSNHANTGGDSSYGSSRRLVEEWRNEVPQDNSRVADAVKISRQDSPPPRSKTPSQTQHLITPFLSFTGRRSSTPRMPSPRSPRVSGGPRQPRNNVNSRQSAAAETLPTPSTSYIGGPRSTNVNTSLYNSNAATARAVNVQSPPEQLSGSSSSVTNAPGTARAKTPIAWLRKQFQRSYSNPSVPHDIDIQIEPPSQSPSDSNPATTVVNPVFLSPEHANQPIPLPHNIIAEATRGVSVMGPSSTPVPHSPITIQLPDEELPLGFVPMTPLIPTSEANSSPPNLREFNRAPANVSNDPPRSTPEIFSPVPNNPSLESDPFTMSPIPRPGTAPGTRSPDRMKSPRSRALSFGQSLKFGGWGGWASPDSARLSRPISMFSDEN